MILVGCGKFLADVNDPNTTVVAQNNFNAYTCSCECKSTTTPTDAAHSIIVTGLDDGVRLQATNRTRLDRDTLELGLDRGNSPTTVGLRFQALGIPRKSHIVSANLHFTAAEDATGPVNLLINVLLVPNAVEFTEDTDLSALTPLTTTPVPWQTSADWTKDQSEAAQTSSDVSSLLQAIVDQTDYTPNSSIVFVISGVAGTTSRIALSFEGSQKRGTVQVQAPMLTFVHEEPAYTQDLVVCVPPAGSIDNAAADCSGRVTNSVRGMAQFCHLANQCTCSFKAANDGKDPKTFSNTCNESCGTLIPIPSECDPEGFAKATGSIGTEPVCLGHSPLGASLFSRRTICEIDAAQSSVSITFVDDDGDTHTRSTGARGRVEFLGDPCPNGECEIGMKHRIHLNDIVIENFFDDNTFNELSGVGESVPTAKAKLNPSGAGTFGALSTINSLRGHHADEDATTALLSKNSSALNVGLGGWRSRDVCTLQGNLAGTANRSFSMSANVRGTLVNQPPTADAGPDQTVECNDTGRAVFFLDATKTSDPDNNITRFGWFKDSRTGELIGAQPRIVLDQALGGPTTYFFKAIDAFGAYGEAKTQVTVVDTTAPAVTAPPDKTAECTGSAGTPVNIGTATATDVCDAALVINNNAPTVFPLGTNTVNWTATDDSKNVGSATQTVKIIDTTPPVLSFTLSPTVLPVPNHKLVTIQATINVSDVCDPNPKIRLVSITSSEADEGLGDGDQPRDIQAAFNEDTRTFLLRAERSGLKRDRIYTVTYEASDASGNKTTKQAIVTVPKGR